MATKKLRKVKSRKIKSRGGAQNTPPAASPGESQPQITSLSESPPKSSEASPQNIPININQLDTLQKNINDLIKKKINIYEKLGIPQNADDSKISDDYKTTRDCFHIAYIILHEYKLYNDILHNNPYKGIKYSLIENHDEKNMTVDHQLKDVYENIYNSYECIQKIYNENYQKKKYTPPVDTVDMEFKTLNDLILEAIKFSK